MTQNPWARASQYLIAVFFASQPPYLVAGLPGAGQSNKILWIDSRGGTGELHITAHPADAPTPAPSFILPAADAPPGNYPSTIDLPNAGCWVLDISDTPPGRLELVVGAGQ